MAGRQHGHDLHLLRRARRQARRQHSAFRERQAAELGLPRVGWRRRRDHPVELAAAACLLQDCAGSRGRQHDRGQGLGGCVGPHAGLRPPRCGGGLSARRDQRDQRYRRSLRHRAHEPSPGAPHRVHGRGRERAPDHPEHGAEHRAGIARARGQVARHRLRRRGSRQRSGRADRRRSPVRAARAARPDRA